MGTVVFLGLPFAGHTNPTIGVTDELVRRGHHVVYFATPQWIQRVESTGAEARLYDGWPEEIGLNAPRNNIQIAADLVRASERILPSLVAELEGGSGLRADVIVMDGLALWGTVLARRTGITSVVSSATFAVNREVRQIYRNSTPRLARTLASGWWRIGAIHSGLRRLDREYRVPLPRIQELASLPAHSTIVYTSRTLQPKADTFGPDVHFVGAVLSGRENVWEDPLPRGFIYVSLGTIFERNALFYRAVLNAFGHADRRVLLNVGPRFEVSLLGPIPGNVTVARGVPQAAVLHGAAAFVTHGGMNSVHESLLAGVPMVIVPQGADNWLVAARVAALGPAVLVRRRQPSAAQLRRATTEILSNGTYARRAKEVGASLGQGGGAAHAASVIEAAMAHGSRRTSHATSRATDETLPGRSEFMR